MFKTSALDLWKEECDRVGIATFCKDLDYALGSGIPQGMITELCGPPGSGKTQLCLQLSVNVQIPQALGGLEGRVAYLDTNYGFSPQRVQGEVFSSFTQDTILNNILYTHVTNYTHVLEAIAVLQNKLYDGEKIRLIVIDSLSFVIRNTITRTLERMKCLHEILTQLHKLAHRFGCAVVTTNDVTTQLISETDGAESQIVPALGGSHSHKINQRIVLGKDDGASDNEQQQDKYVALIEKCHFTPKISIAFRIENGGIRSVKRKQ
uniref:DNA repair protein RAD51 homolog 3 n=1 Tax=Anopheles atroparvus TaxID=41427 RepID=A0A182JI33_ANOAO